MTTNKPIADTSAAFLVDLSAEHQPLLARTTGTLRFETDEEPPAYVVITIAEGAVTVSHEFKEADAVVRGDRRLFDDVICGRANAMAAVLRGDLVIEGDPELLSRFQRVFPGPAEATGDQTASTQTVSSP